MNSSPRLRMPRAVRPMSATATPASLRPPIGRVSTSAPSSVRRGPRSSKASQYIDGRRYVVGTPASAKNLSASDLASKCGTLYLPSNTGMLGSSSGRYPRGPFALLRDSQATDAGGLDRAGADGVDPDAAARA